MCAWEGKENHGATAFRELLRDGGLFSLDRRHLDVPLSRWRGCNLPNGETGGIHHPIDSAL